MSESKSIPSFFLIAAIASLIAGSIACTGDDEVSGTTDASVAESEPGVDTGTAPEPSPDPLEIVTATLPAGEAGAGYGPISLEARGGPPPYTWSIADGDEPRPDFLERETGRLSGVVWCVGQTKRFGLSGVELPGWFAGS